MNRKRSFLSAAICLIVCAVFPVVNAEADDFIPLSGTMPAVIEKQESPYLVSGVLEVGEGQKVVIEKGVVFLFKNFAGLSIKGTIVARGTREDPVVFTSENDTLYNPASTLEPAPFDWDGITVYRSDSISIFKHCVVSYSLFGIKSDTRKIELDRCSFIQNGNADFTAEGEKQPVTYPFYSFSPLKEELSDAVRQQAPAEADVLSPTQAGPKPEVKTQRPKEEKKKKVDIVQQTPPKRSGSKVVFRLLSGAAFFAGGALGAVQTMDYFMAKEDFDRIHDCSYEDRLLYTSKDWEDAKQRTNEHARNMVICYGIAALGVTVFTFTFAF